MSPPVGSTSSRLPILSSIPPTIPEPPSPTDSIAESHTESEYLHDDSKSLVIVYESGRHAIGTSELKDRAVKTVLHNPPESIASRALDLAMASRADFLLPVPLAIVRESLEQFYQERDSQIQRTFSAPIPIDDFVDVSLVQEKAQADAEQEILDESSDRNIPENIFKLDNKEAISFEGILKLKKEDQPLSVLIVGRPGIGKSILSQRCGRHWWSPKGIWKEQFDLVFIIKLGLLPTSTTGEQRSLEELVFNEFFNHRNEAPIKSEREIRNLLGVLTSHRILFILDGYDEFPAGSIYRRAIDQRLLGKQSYYSVILTSRSYKKPPDVAFDAVLECIGLSSEKILAFLKTCNSAKAEEIWRSIQKNPVLHSLAHVPLLLEMIALTWEKLSQNQDTPLTMTELYAAMHEKMGDAFDQRQAIRTPGVVKAERDEKRKQAEKFTAELAFRALQTGNTLFGQVVLEATKKHCQFSDVDSLLEPGFINGRAITQKYYFPHLTLQEHWAALYLVQALIENEKVYDQEIKPVWVTVHEFIRRNKYNPRYIVVWEFVAGILGSIAKVTESRPGDIEPLQQFFNCMLEGPRDLFRLYDLRFLQFLKEANLEGKLQGSDHLLALYEIYLKADLDETIKLPIIPQGQVRQILTLCCPMNDRILEMLIANLGKPREDIASGLFQRIIESSTKLPSNTGHLLVRVLVQTQKDVGAETKLSSSASRLSGRDILKKMKDLESSRAASVLESLANSAYDFASDLKEEIKKLLTRKDPKLQQSAIIILARLAKSRQIPVEEVASLMLKFMMSSVNLEIKRAVIDAFRDVAKGGKLPMAVFRAFSDLLSHPSSIKTAVDHTLVGVIKAGQTLPSDLLEIVISRAIANQDGSNVLKAMVQAKQPLSEKLVGRIIQAKAARLLKNLVKVGLILSDSEVEEVFEAGLDEKNSDTVRSDFGDVLEEVMKDKHYLPDRFPQKLFDKLLAVKPEDDYDIRFYICRFLEEVLKSGKPVQETEIHRLSTALAGINVSQRISAAYALEKISKFQKLPKEIIPILRNALCVNSKVFFVPFGFDVHPKLVNSSHSIVSSILQVFANQIEEIISEDLLFIVSLMGVNSHELTSLVLSLLGACLKRAILLPINTVEKLSKLLLQEEMSLHHRPAAQLLVKLSRIPSFAGSVKDSLQTLHKTLAEMILGGDYLQIHRSYSTLRTLLIMGANFPPETIRALESALGRCNSYSSDAAKLLGSFLQLGKKLEPSTILTLENALSSDDATSYSVTEALVRITSHGQKLSDESIKTLVLLILQKGNGWLMKDTQIDELPKSALLVIGNIAKSLHDWIETYVLEKLRELELTSTNPYLTLNAVNILRVIAWNRKSLSTETIKWLLSIPASKASGLDIVGVIDLSKQLDTVKDSNLDKTFLVEVLASTPLKVILESKVFTSEETGWIVAHRLISRNTALCFHEQENKLSFFENGKLQEIFLSPKQIAELLPAIRAAASSQIGIDLDKLA